MRTIWIEYDDKHVAVDAYAVSGGLAVHRTPGQKTVTYSVTHLGTGVSVRTYIPSLRLARRIMKALVESKIPWREIKSSKDATPYHAQVLALVRAVEESCASIV